MATHSKCDNLPEYIERNKVYELIGQTGVARIHVSDIDVIPTADVVPVVRCRECKRWESNCNGKAGICQKRKGVARANDFCSYGERKEGADNA